jgi:tRNA (guanine-N7-)-methyltransferase
MENPLGGINASTWLEIGFGYGEHLVGLAMRYPDVYFIGCEPFINGVATMLKQIDDNKVENIRIFHGDARLLIEKLPSASVDRLFILFPDPWPKSKHHKKRIITKESLKDFARIIKIGGKLDIATDHAHYGKWIEEHFAESFEFVANKILGIDSIPEDWVETRYQLKAREQGRGARFFNLLRVG